MLIIFLTSDENLLESMAPLKAEVQIIREAGDLPEIIASQKSGGILFVDFDDPDFDLEASTSYMVPKSGQKSPFLTVLVSKMLSVKEFKKLQSQYPFVDTLLRSPIKLKDIESFVEDYILVQKESRDAMAEPKKKDFEDPLNAKIQRKFDLIFTKPKLAKSPEHSTVFNHGTDNNFDDADFNLDGDMSMSNGAKKTSEPAPNIDFDFESTSTGIDFSGSTNEDHQIESAPAPVKDAAKLAVVPDDNGLDFNLDFGDDSESSEIPKVPDAPAIEKMSEATHVTTATASNHFELELGEDEGFEFDSAPAPAVQVAAAESGAGLDMPESSDELDTMFDEAIADSKNHMAPEGTQKTIIFDKSQHSANLEEHGFDPDITASTNSSADLMSTEEAKANIDATIKDILRPKNLDSTQEINIEALSEDDHFSEFEFSEKSGTGTPSLGFNAKEVSQIHDHKSESSQTGEFDLSSMDFAEKDAESFDSHFEAEEEKEKEEAPVAHIHAKPSADIHNSYVSDEDSNRFQVTIRQLREERENLINQLKMLKGETRELEQDNLTLKAALDETKIEVSILRKRHMVELEDMKYRVSVNEEKKAMAIEAARLAESKREKLEQRVRIDFNQVKQREKELETKLEMLTIDVDSQVHSRDQKILELRRKIDALEFNMENVSIKEQKSEDDKRKLEDKLSKIMKTLRHSIKNLEDDIDQVNDEVQENRNNTYPRSNKA